MGCTADNRGKYEDSDVSWPEIRVRDVRPGQHFEMDFMTLSKDILQKKVNGKYEELTQEFIAQQIVCCLVCPTSQLANHLCVRYLL